MGNGPNYMQRLVAATQAGFTTGCSVGFQKSADLFGVALYEEGFGEARLERIALRVRELEHEYGDAWNDAVEADYQQEQIDRVLKKAYGKNFVPFETRNPDIKKITYGKKGKR